MFAYLVFWFIEHMGLGAIIYNFDRKRLSKLYQAASNLTREKPLDADVRKGLVTGQPTQRRFWVALLIASLQIIAIAQFSHENPMTYLSVWVIGIIGLMAGFYVGPLAGKWWEKKDTVFTAIDNAETKKLEEPPVPVIPSNPVQNEVWNRTGHEQVEEVPAKKTVEPEPDPRDAFEKFIES